MILAFAACGKNENNINPETETEPVTEQSVTEENTTLASSEKKTASTDEETTANTVETEETTAAEMSKEEIVALYNESANKIKATAKLITRIITE